MILNAKQRKNEIESICDNLLWKVTLEEKIREYWFCLFKEIPKVLLNSKRKSFEDFPLKRKSRNIK